MLFSSSAATAQTDSVSNEDDRPHFKIGAYYNSALNYYGRTDSLKSSGIFPIAELWFNKNFYVTAAPVFVNNSSLRLIMRALIATVGYQFNEKDKWFGNFYLSNHFMRAAASWCNPL